MGRERAEWIRASADFTRLLRQGVRLNGKLFVLAVCENDQQRSRLGLSVGRRVGGAVQRNRVKRLLREAYRRSVSTAPPLDAVAIAKPEIVGCALRDILEELQRRFAIWERRRHSSVSRSTVRPDPR